MHIFLDTTVTHDDPFFVNNYNRNLLKLTRENKDITFYMSNIVYLETKRHYTRKIQSLWKNINESRKQLKHFTFSVYTLVDEESETTRAIKQFEQFYEDLQKENALIIIDCPNNILPQLIERAVNRIKPFKEHKSEFRDAATWLTYAEYVNKNNLDNCYLISNNTNDFYDEAKEKLHPDLYKDCDKLIPYITLKKMATEDKVIGQYIKGKEKEEAQVVQWMEDKHINEEYVIRVFKNQPLYNDIFSKIYHYISQIDSSTLHNAFYGGETLRTIGIDLMSVQDLSIEFIAEEIIISGELIIEATCEVDEEVDEEFGIVRNMEFQTSFRMDLLLNFSFKLSMDESISNMQFEKLRKSGNIHMDFTQFF